MSYFETFFNHTDILETKGAFGMPRLTQYFPLHAFPILVDPQILRLIICIH